MNGDGGWIKIHRNILKNPWMNNANVLGTWVYILLNVAYQPEDVVFEGKRITLQPGQGLFKFNEMAKILGIPKSTLYRVIELFKSEKQIEKQSSPRNTLVTVVNWEKYQVNGKQNGKQMGNKWETDGKQMGNLHINNKNLRNKEIKKVYGTYQNVFLTDEEFQKLKAEFPDWQERIDRLSEYIESKGAKYKNHLATIRSWARRDKQNGTNMDRQSAGKEPGVEVYERVIREAEERRKAGLVGTVPVGSRPAEQGVRTYPWQRKSTV